MNKNVNPTSKVIDRLTITYQKNDNTINQHVIDVERDGFAQPGVLIAYFGKPEETPQGSTCDVELQSNCSPVHAEHLVDCLIKKYHLPYARTLHPDVDLMAMLAEIFNEGGPEQ